MGFLTAILTHNSPEIQTNSPDWPSFAVYARVVLMTRDGRIHVYAG